MSASLKNLYLLIFILTILVNYTINSFVLCDDDKTACPSNYVCCKRTKGYICCYKTLICCRNGKACCESNFLGDSKQILNTVFL